MYLDFSILFITKLIFNFQWLINFSMFSEQALLMVLYYAVQKYEVKHAKDMNTTPKVT